MVPICHVLTTFLLFVIISVCASRSSHRESSNKDLQRTSQKDFTPYTMSLEIQPVRNRSTDKPVAEHADNLTVVICALLKNEDRYIDEWIKYNKYLGFDHIHVYDNSEQGSAHLGYLPQKFPNFVDVYHYPAKSPQLRAYTHCGTRYNQSSVWAAFIDIDEFIVLKKHQSIKHLLHSIVPYGGALSLNRIFFGSNNLTRYDQRPVVERFTRRKESIDNLVKTISYIPDVTLFEIHYTLLREGMKRIDCHGTEQGHRRSVQSNGTKASTGTEDVAVIHHYYTKSLEEFRNKRQRGDASKFERGKQYHDRNGEKLILDQFNTINEHANSLYDPTALWFYGNKSVEYTTFPIADVFANIA